MFETEERVHSARPVHHDTHLYVGQEVVMSKREPGMFGRNGVISHVGYSRLLGEVIYIDFPDLLLKGCGSFERTEFRIRTDV
ncbi:hypothetical protein ABT033_37845 [Streptomyces pharetrae]|uniref:hypothetical protein n=1 Tax=Streptomyces pharetrae TaxID=291370 RepID=UPI0033502964